jgi:4-methylaminobutanoate oxidase (formaldehyde-forming)
VADNLPTLRDPDANFYAKQEPAALAIGGWEKETRAVNGYGKLPMGFGQELFPDDLDRISEVIEGASDRIPVWASSACARWSTDQFRFRPMANR